MLTTQPATHIDLSHVITDGMTTYPGLPEPTVADHLSREAAEEIYGPGITFQIGLVTMCTNTGTYLDVPFHRYADGHDLTGLALERVAAIDAVLLDRRGERVIELDDLDSAAVAGKAVLVWTGHAATWGTPDYFENHPALTGAAAERLRDAGVACVGIDTLNIDATEGTGERPVHSTLLRAEIPIIEHMTNLDVLAAALAAESPAGSPAEPSAESTDSAGFTFTAVPPKIEGCGTFTVRAFATL